MPPRRLGRGPASRKALPARESASVEARLPETLRLTASDDSAPPLGCAAPARRIAKSNKEILSACLSLSFRKRPSSSAPREPQLRSLQHAAWPAPTAHRSSKPFQRDSANKRLPSPGAGGRCCAAAERWKERRRARALERRCASALLTASVSARFLRREGGSDRRNRSRPLSQLPSPTLPPPTNSESSARSMGKGRNSRHSAAHSPGEVARRR